MIGVIRLAEARVFVCMRFPVEVTAVDDTTSYGSRMSVHIFGRRMRNDIGTPFERATVDRCGKCIVDDQWYAMFVSDTGKLFNIQYHHSRIGDRFAEQ